MASCCEEGNEFSLSEEGAVKVYRSHPHCAGICVVALLCLYQRLSVCLLQPATEHTSAMWVEPTTWRLDGPGRTDYPSCVTSTLPQAARTLGTWCRWVCDWVSPRWLHPEPQPVSDVRIPYCVFVTKTLNTEERWPEGHVSQHLLEGRVPETGGALLCTCHGG